uniref:Uncharacterized protein n=1 Tax=Tanacetum cinerariifolium TaxID=118510 RepID=A0A6L2LLH5_TANCI|nr:hypothetical protein [Tanacetum cinerariifolium]
MISPAFVKANYEALESLLRDQRRQMRNNDLRTELEYFSEDYDKEREIEPRPKPTRAATPPLRVESPRICRRGERTVGFEGAQSRGESRVERNTEGRRPSEEAPREMKVLIRRIFLDGYCVLVFRIASHLKPEWGLIPSTTNNLRIVSSGVKPSSGWLPVWESATRSPTPLAVGLRRNYSKGQTVKPTFSISNFPTRTTLSLYGNLPSKGGYNKLSQTGSIRFQSLLTFPTGKSGEGYTRRFSPPSKCETGSKETHEEDFRKREVIRKVGTKGEMRLEETGSIRFQSLLTFPTGKSGEGYTRRFSPPSKCETGSKETHEEDFRKREVIRKVGTKGEMRLEEVWDDKKGGQMSRTL